MTLNCLQVPVIANGNIQSLQDVKNCIEQAGVQGVSIDQLTE